MIWDQLNVALAQKKAWVDYIERDVCGVAQETMDGAVAGEVANAVVGYCLGVACRDYISQNELAAQVSRALWGIGEKQLASRYLEKRLPSRQVRSTLLHLLSVSDVSPSLWNLVVRGIIRRYPSCLEARRDMWRLDVKSLVEDREAMMDLSKQALVKSALRCMAPVWDSDQGSGLLGVRYPSRGRRGTGRNPDEWFIHACLRNEACKRHWQDIPRLIRLHG